MSDVARLKRTLVTKTSHAMARHSRSRLVRIFGRVAGGVSRAIENDSANHTQNGEARVLDLLSTHELVIILDVGAHHGGWARHVLEHFPNSQIHCFEIEPTNRARLASALANDERVTIADSGLGRTPGEVELWIDPRHPDMASTIAASTAATTRLLCAVSAGDDYLNEQAIEFVDFLKIDVEGAEIDVLAGFEDALASARIGMIQFEFTLWSAVARVWLADFYELLEPLGFTLGKIYPTYVDWRSYEPRQEIFVRANFLAVHESKSDCIDRLR